MGISRKGHLGEFIIICPQCKSHDVKAVFTMPDDKPATLDCLCVDCKYRTEVDLEATGIVHRNVEV